MTSPNSGSLPSSLSVSAKGSPFRKSNYFRTQSINTGNESPGRQKPKVRQGFKTPQVHPDKIVEEGFQLVDADEEDQREGGELSQKHTQEEHAIHMRSLELPEAFEKYALTTDVPFFGVRTTKAKIEPVKSADIIPRTNSNAKNTEDVLMNLSGKKFRPIRSKSRLLPSQSKVMNPIESKPSVDRSGKKNRDKDSHSNLEKDSHKQESRNSLDMETEAKENPAFLTEAHHSHNSFEKQASGERSQDGYDSGNREEDDNMQRFDDRNRGQNFRYTRDTKTAQTEKHRYNPMAILNKIRNKDSTGVHSPDNRNGQMGLLSGSPQRSDSLMKPKTSQPRDFTVLRSKKMNLFEGIPYVPYDIFLRQDTNMQNVMIKDLLKILLDKAKSLKNLFHDNYRMDRIMRNIEEAEQSALNLHTEETIGLVNAVASLIMQEFRDSIDKIGIKSSPIFDNPNLKLTDFDSEIERFSDNSTIFLDTIDHLRDCIDCYYVMSRQKDRKPIPDADCSDLLQFIARARYNLGQLYEAFRVIEKHVDAKVTWENENDPVKVKEKMKKLQNQEASPNKNKLKADTYKLLNELLQNKFNINKNKLAATIESKVILNQEAEDEKFLTILQNQKQLKKKAGTALGDNRKLIILNRLLNPIEDPQIQAAIKVAQEKTHVQLSRDLLEYMATKAKGFDMKAHINKDLPLKNNLEKILSNDKLTQLCFKFNDAKEQQEIRDKLATRGKGVEMKEIVTDVFNHTITKKHLNCLFDKESHENTTLTLAQKNLKLPKLPKPSKKAFLQTR